MTLERLFLTPTAPSPASAPPAAIARKVSAITAISRKTASSMKAAARSPAVADPQAQVDALGRDQLAHLGLRLRRGPGAGAAPAAVMRPSAGARGR